MKKILVVIISIVLIFAFAGCGGDTPTEDEMINNNDVSEEATEDATGDVFFKDNVLQLEEYKIEITDYNVVEKGKGGNQYGDSPVIVFDYKITNISDSSLEAYSAWIYSFTAIQDNDPNTLNELDTSIMYDFGNKSSSKHDKIKIGGVVESSIAYELSDEETPVTLIASKLFGGEIGSQEFSLK